MPQVPTMIPDRQKIRQLRLAKGLTPERMAMQMPGKHRGQTIRRIEADGSWSLPRLSVYFMHELAEFFSVTVADITATNDEDGIAA